MIKNKAIIKNKQKYEGKIFKDSDGNDIKILEYVSSQNCKILFYNGFIKNGVSIRHIIEENVKNPFNPSVYGVGFIGVGKYRASYKSKKSIEYKTWLYMLRRCYSKDKKQNRNSVVCEEWHNFQVFAQWFEENYVEGFHLDKDLLSNESKIYSPETCCFVPQEINSAIQVTDYKNLPQGISKQNGKYLVRISKFNNTISIGVFNTIDEAKEVFCKYKKEYLFELSEKYKNVISNKVYTGLRNYNKYK